jgi:hypothetical protein
MTSRGASIILVLAALVVHFGWAAPAWREGAILTAQAGMLRSEKDALLGRLDAIERADSLTASATRMESGAAEAVNDDSVVRLRRSLLDGLRGQPVSAVRLEVVPAHAPLAAEGRLHAEGSFADVVRLSGHLVRPGAGFVLKTVRLARTTHGSLALEVEGLSVLAGTP